MCVMIGIVITPKLVSWIPTISVDKPLHSCLYGTLAQCALWSDSYMLKPLHAIIAAICPMKHSFSCGKKTA